MYAIIIESELRFELCSLFWVPVLVYIEHYSTCSYRSCVYMYVAEV